MAAEAEGGVLGGHALAVVPDGDEPLPAVEELDADLGRPGVEGVLDELLDDGDRPFDDLAGGDLPGELGRQDANSLHGTIGHYIHVNRRRRKTEAWEIPPCPPFPKGGSP